jgi:outer membrane receptor for ferrienterochelin and colicin
MSAEIPSGNTWSLFHQGTRAFAISEIYIKILQESCRNTRRKEGSETGCEEQLWRIQVA